MARSVAYGAGRELLIASTVEVVADRGLRGMTFRAVAEHAGVNNSLVAHHFGTRDTLLAAALEWTVEQSIETTHLLDLSSEEAFADALFDSIAEHPELHVFQYAMILEARHTALYQEPVMRLYARFHEAAERGLIALGLRHDVETTARWLFAALDGIVLQSMAGVAEDDLRQGLHGIWKQLERAIEQPASG